MSIKLTDTQLVLLGAAAQRKDLCLVAPPTLKGATAQKVASKLISAGFVKEVKAKAGDPVWRRDERASYALKLTATGAKAIAVDDAAEPEDAGEASPSSGLMARRRPPRGAGEGLLRPTPGPKSVLALDDMIAALVELDANGLCLQWRNHLGGALPPICRVGCS